MRRRSNIRGPSQVKYEMSIGRYKRLEVICQRSVGGQVSKVGGQISEVGGQVRMRCRWSDIMGQRSCVRGRRSDIGGRRSSPYEMSIWLDI